MASASIAIESMSALCKPSTPACLLGCSVAMGTGMAAGRKFAYSPHWRCDDCADNEFRLEYGWHERGVCNAVNVMCQKHTPIVFAYGESHAWFQFWAATVASMIVGEWGLGPE